MRIERVELENWMSYPRRWTPPDQPDAGDVVPTIDFSGQSLVLITGDNGAGKSAILEAICYALFADYPRSRRNQAAIRSGERKAKVRLHFTLPSVQGPVTYCIERVLTPSAGTTNAQLKQLKPDGSTVTLQSGQSQVTEYVVQQLLHGVGYDAFVSTVFLRQDEAGLFMGMSHADQREQLLHLCHLDIYSQIHKSAQEHRKELANLVKQLQEEFDRVEYATEAYLNSQRRAVNELQSERDRLKSDEEDARQLREKVKLAATLAGEIGEAKQQLEQWSHILVRVAEIRHAGLWTTAWERVRNPLAQAADLSQKQSLREAEINQTQRDLTAAAEDAANKNNQNDELSAGHQSLQEALRKANSALLSLTRKRASAREALTRAQTAAALDARIARARAEQQERQAQLKQLESTKRKRVYCALLTQTDGVLQPVLQTFHEADEDDTTAREKDTEAQEARREADQLQVAVQGEEAQLSELDKSTTALILTRSGLQREHAASTDIIQNRTRAREDGVCPTCGTAIVGDISEHVCREIQEHAARVAMLEHELEAIEQELRANQAATVSLRAERDRLARQRMALDSSATQADAAATKARASATRRHKQASDQWRQLLARWRDIPLPDWLREPSAEAQEVLRAELVALADVEAEYRRLTELDATYKAQAESLARDEKSRAELDISSPITEEQLAELAAAFDALEADAEEAEKEQKRLDGKRAEVERRLTAAKSAWEAAERVRANLDTKLTRLTASQREAESHLSAITESLRSEQQKTEREFPDLAGSLLAAIEGPGALRALESLAQAYLQVAGLQGELDQAESDSAKVKTEIQLKEKSLQELQKETGSISEEDASLRWQRIHDELGTAEQALLDATREVGKIERDHETRQDLDPRLRDTQKQHWAYKAIEVAIDPGTKTRPPGPLFAHITERLMESIGLEASRILDSLGWLIRITYDESSGFSVEDRALSATRAYKEYSGGERFAIAIAVALAIGRVTHGAGNIRCLFIDEGFGALDRKHRKRIIDDAIGRLIEVGTRDQVVVISHLRDLQEYFPTRIELRREGDRSALGSPEEEY